MEHSPATGAGRPFGGYGEDHGDQRSWVASLATSSILYVLLAAIVAVIGGRQVAKVAEKVVDVTFVRKKIIEPPAPPPVIQEQPKAVPPPEVKAKPAAAPVVRPDQKIRKLDAPPPPKELVAPKDMPTDAAPEADPSLDQGIAVYGDGAGDVAGLEGGVAGGRGAGSGGMVEDADPPVPAADNRVPEYPAEMIAAGRMATVQLRLLILADGTVKDVRVMRGDEPFVAAVMKVVKTWKFTPAKYRGQPVSYVHVIEVPFKLT